MVIRPSYSDSTKVIRPAQSDSVKVIQRLSYSDSAKRSRSYPIWIRLAHSDSAKVIQRLSYLDSAMVIRPEYSRIRSW